MCYNIHINNRTVDRMYKPKREIQNEAEFVFIDDLVPQDPIDFSFIGERVRPFYSENNGRPSDPIQLFKMMFIDIFMAFVLNDN